jgi:hypothetical protein
VAAAGNTVTRGTAVAACGGVAKDISDLVIKLEDDGYIPNAGIARTGLRGMIRGLGAAQTNLVSAALGSQLGVGLVRRRHQLPMRGLWPTAVSTVEGSSGLHPTRIGVRSDFTLITEGHHRRRERDHLARFDSVRDSCAVAFRSVEDPRNDQLRPPVKRTLPLRP